MRRMILAGCLLISTAAPALAASIDALSEALSQVPVSVLADPAPVQVTFIDMQAVRELSKGEPFGPAQLNRIMLGASLRPVEALAAGGPEAWEAKAGVPLADIHWFAGFGTPPSTVSLWGMKDEAAASRLSDKLVSMGFGASGTPGVVSNGEPMKVDLLHADRADPWHSAVGAASFVAPKGEVMVVASMPDIAGQVVASPDGAAANPIVATALVGLGQATGDGSILGAMLISPALGLRSGDPAILLADPTADLDALRKKLEAQAANAGAGIPPYFGGLVADVQRNGAVVAIALTYPDCTIAKAAADSIAEKLKAMRELASGQISAATVDGVSGLCAATITVVPPPDAPPGMLLAGFMQGQPGVLQIGG